MSAATWWCRVSPVYPFSCSPTVTIGYSTVNFCTVPAQNLSATPGAFVDASAGLTFPVPTGEGVSFGVVVTAGDQSTAALQWTLSYAPASVARILPEAASAGVPTTGGTRIILLGRGFGSHVLGSPTAWGWGAKTGP